MLGRTFDRWLYGFGVGPHQRDRIVEKTMRMHIDGLGAAAVDHHRLALGPEPGMLVRQLRMRRIDQAAGAERQA